ncbi:hypothetical protein [Frankia sp. Cppng1_Ct_nod]|uniref:hypothetical protein n=1 Tax=Frankia sp. Cppng1_Ct_nod TaxID=2897162 RepID=UPI00104157C0|nr:hypothetical protein [Frankia sp. Cppng1_Ct_nod]
MAGSRGRGYGRWGEREQAPSADDAAAWFTGRLPDDWFTGPPTVTVDRDEIIVVGVIPAPELETADAGAATAVTAAESGRIRRFREQTRDARIAIAEEAERRYVRKVAWGVTAGGTTELFTTLSVPVMTRLRQPERHVLDTLVDSGVARSRSDALAWCVRLVGDNAQPWLARLREAMEKVEQVRAEGPEL